MSSDNDQNISSNPSLVDINPSSPESVAGLASQDQPSRRRRKLLMRISGIIGAVAGLTFGIIVGLAIFYTPVDEDLYWTYELRGKQQAIDRMGPLFIQMEKDGKLDEAVIREYLNNPPEAPAMEE